MGLFSKEECSFCEKKVGFLGRKIIANKEGYICKECEKKCSALINVSHFTKAELRKHMDYMEKQNKIYEEKFETIDKKDRKRFVCISTGIEFADDIEMFTYISPETNKKVYKELFKYDQIKSYEPYFKENKSSQNGKKYYEVGMVIYLNCSRPEFGEVHRKDIIYGRNVHPYVSEIKVPTKRDTDNKNDYMSLKNQLDKIFSEKDINESEVAS